MIITKGATGTFGVLFIANQTTGDPETGVVFDDFASSQIEFQVSGGAVTVLTLLASVPNAAWAEGNFSELFNGYYQVALPDSIAAASGKMVTFSGELSGLTITCEPIMVLPAFASDLANMIEDSGTATPQFTADSLYYGPQSTLISFGGMTVYLSVDQRVRLYIVEDINKNPIEGLVAADITEFWYQRDGEDKVVVVLADGSGLSSVHADGNFNEVADGWYQIDVPDTAWAKGSSTVVFGGSSTGNVILSESISLGSDVIRSPTLTDLDNMIDDSNTLTPQWSTDAMLKLPNLTVLPYVGTSITRSDSTLLDLYVGELMTNTINVKDRDGNPIDLSAFTLYMVIESFDKVDLQLLNDGDLGHAGAFVIFTNAAPVTANPTTNTNYHLYSLRKVGTHEVVIQGKIRVTYAALED